jgi:N-acetylglucosamine-6-phosphate deacetylase
VTGRTELVGRLVIDDRIVAGRLAIADGMIVGVDVDGDEASGTQDATTYAPGFVDVHVHGWGGHDAMGDPAALDGMARALARRGVTSFLPTAASAPLETLTAFTDRVRAWRPSAPDDGAEPLGANLEGPFLAQARKGAHDPRYLRDPGSVTPDQLARLVDGIALITVAPERPGALELITDLRARGIRVSMGHSAATLDESAAGYAAGGSTTTHLFNAMVGLDHRAPGLAATALLDDDAYVELIADGYHVHPALWRLIHRVKPRDRVMLVSDALSLAGTGVGRVRMGATEMEVIDGRVVMAGTTTLAGSIIALDDAVRNLVAAGIPLADAVAAASTNPLAMLGVGDRGRLAVGQRADIVALDADLGVRGVWRAGRAIDLG